VNVLIVLGHF